MIATFYVVVKALIYISYTWYLIFLKRYARMKKVDWPMRWYDRASHGRNFIAQYTPLALLLLAIIELNGADAAILHGLGILLVVAALLHVHSFRFPARIKSGMVAMVLVTGIYGVASLVALLQLAGEL